MTATGPQFGRVPVAPIFDGALKRIADKPAALMLYVLYLAHSDRTMHAYVGEGRVIELTGMDASTVTRARRALEAAALIVDTGRRVKGCKVYRIEHVPPHPRGVSTNETTPQRCGESEERDPASVRVNPPHRCVPNRVRNRVHQSAARSRKVDPLWDVVCEACGITDPKGSDRARIVKAVKQLRERDATPDAVRDRAARYRELWPNLPPVTPWSLERNWTTLASGNGHGDNPLHVHVEPDDAEIIAAGEEHARIEREAAARRDGEP